MTTLAHHLALGASALALLATGVRATSPALASGLIRLVGAAVVAASLAAAESLAVTAVGLGLRTPVLTLAALGTYAAAWRLLPRPAVPIVDEPAAWWSKANLPARLSVAGACGAAVAWIVYALRHPLLGFDTLLYHLPTPLSYVQEQSATAVAGVMDHIPVGSYPAMYELLAAWSVGISDSLVPFTALPVLMLLLGAVAAYAGLRELRVTVGIAALGAAVLFAAPQAMGWQFTGAVTDPAATTWLICCGALAAASLRRPAAFPLALMAGALSLATKLTSGPLVVLVLVLITLRLRGRILESRRALAAAGALAAVVGLYGYARNTVRFGSPLYPFYGVPWGDPAPDVLAHRTASFSDHWGPNLRWLGHKHLSHFAGSLLVLAAGVAAPLISRRREVLLAAAATFVSVALWTQAPFTGLSEAVFKSLEPPPTPLSTVRYLLPALACAVAALALASRAGGVRRRVVEVLLATGLAVEVVQGQTELGGPAVAPILLLVGGAAAGAVLAYAAARRGGSPSRAATVGLEAGAMLAACVGLAVAADGYAARHNRIGEWQSNVATWLDGQPGFAGTDAVVVGMGVRPGILTGSHLRHRVKFVSRDTGCPAVARETRGAWVVVFDWGVPSRPLDCLASRRPAFSEAPFRVYAPR